MFFFYCDTRKILDNFLKIEIIEKKSKTDVRKLNAPRGGGNGRFMNGRMCVCRSFSLSVWLSASRTRR